MRGLKGFEMVCKDLGKFEMVCKGLRRFEIICKDLNYFDSEHTALREIREAISPVKTCSEVSQNFKHPSFKRKAQKISHSQ